MFANKFYYVLPETELLVEEKYNPDGEEIL